MRFTPLAAAVTAVLLTGCGTPAEPPNPIADEKQTSSAPLFDAGLRTQAYQYFLRYGLDKGITDADIIWDAELIRRNRADGAEDILLPSIKEALPALQDIFNHSLILTAAPSDDLLILRSALMETDSGWGDLYAFTPNSSALTRMRFHDVVPHIAHAAVSPTGTMLAVVPSSDSDNGNADTIILVDLVTDTPSTLIRLGGNETLNNAGYGLDAYYDIAWTDDRTLRYAVYDIGTTDPQLPQSHRTVTIDQ